MTSQARETLLSALSAFRSVLDEQLVLGGTSEGAFVRKGMTVAAYNLLETFVVGRLGEVADLINSGNVQFLDLPTKLQRSAIDNTIRIAGGQLQWREDDLVSLRSFSLEIAGSLGAVSHSINISPLTWQWRNSNMAPKDLHRALRLFHVKEPWTTMNKLYFGCSGRSVDFKDRLNNLMDERHKCAHDGGYTVTALWLRTVPEVVLATSLVFDVLASISACLLRDGDQSHMTNENSVSVDSVAIGFVQQRTRDWADLPSGAARARRRGPTPDPLFADAVARVGRGEVVVQRDKSNNIQRWFIGAAE